MYTTTDTINRSTQTPTKEAFVTIEGVSKVYPTPRGPYTVLKDVNLSIDEGEFICG
jgi:bicarbonate transport system ATP-binding protein